MKRTTEWPPVLHATIFVSILALAAFLRFYCLTCSSLWHDEGNSWALAQRSFAQIAVDAAADIHPPGYYWLLKLWAGRFRFLRLGHSQPIGVCRPADGGSRLRARAGNRPRKSGRSPRRLPSSPLLWPRSIRSRSSTARKRVCTRC